MASFDMGMESLLPTATVTGWLEAVNPTGYPVDEGYAIGMRMALKTTILIAVLELLSISTVLGMLRKQPSLYLSAWLTSLRNNLVFGPVTAFVAFRILCTDEELDEAARWRRAISVVLIHSVCYYTAHRAMHTKALYWAHKYHHKFNEFVPPSSANAVSIAEYGIAYMLPFIIGAGIVRPDVKSMYTAVGIVSLTNLLIHTPPLEAVAAAVLPGFVVGTHGHIEHHQKLTTNYAAPTVNIDWFLRCSTAVSSLADRFFLAVGGKPVAVQSKKRQ